MTFLASILGGLALLPFTLAIPSQNLTALRTEVAPAWVSDPDDRGTWSLLYSNIFTLSLCVWSALHPNLPSPSFGQSIARYGTKISSLLLAIVAPELMVLTAFRQLQQARHLVSELTELRAQHFSKSDSPAQSLTDSAAHARKSFSLTYGFYVLMGGLAVDVSPIHDRLQIVPLTPNGVLHLARKGHFIAVSDEEIKDKSKANLLAKTLVLLQISWTMLQCVSRKISGLPIAILEVHTLIHASCALIMYALWFKKPMDVEEPTVISTTSFYPEIALMLVRNHHCGIQPIGNLVLPKEFYKARYIGRYRDWPGLQASEASYLVFNPSRSEESDSSSKKGPPSVVHLDDPRLSTNDTVVEELEHNARCQESLPSGIDGLGPVNRHSSQCLAVGMPDSQPSPPDICNKDFTGISHYRGNSLLKFIAPNVHERRKAAYDYKSCRLVESAPADPGMAASQDTWLGFHSYPPLGVPTQFSLCTGEFMPGGIGPSAFLSGHWIVDLRFGCPQPQPKIREISEQLKQRLPLQKIDLSSVAFYCLLKISLSQRDLRRWHLASRALHKEYSSMNIKGDQKDQLIDFSGPGGSLRDVYFTTSHAGRSLAVDEVAAIQSAERNRHILVIQGFFHVLVGKKHIRWKPAPMILAGTSMLYAALHLALWTYEFPTTAEKLLWRISASTLLAIPTLALFYLLASIAYHHVISRSTRTSQERVDHELQSASTVSDAGPATNTQLHTDLEENATSTSSARKKANPPGPDGYIYPTSTTVSLIEWGAIAILPFVLLYLFSRVFIIVESFLSLRHVPIGVYTSVGWSKYIPHL